MLYRSFQRVVALGHPLALITFVLVTISGCTLLKAKEAPDSGFLPHPERLEEHRERFPFNKVWLKDYSEQYYERYTKILIAPVDTRHIHAHDWADELSLEGKQEFQRDIKHIANYMQEKFIQSLKEDENPRYVLANSSDHKTMILELALVELIPTKAWLNVSGQVVSFFVPGASFVAGQAATGSVAIEGRIRDGATNEIIAMFKDRESDQLAPIGIQDYTWYKHAEDEIDDWAAQFVEVLDTKAHHKVADSSPLTFRIW